MTPLSCLSSKGGVGVALSPSHGPHLYSSPLLAIRRCCPLLVIHHRCCPLFVPRSLSFRRRCS
ncbi:hypothetical protein L208DRAFT_1384363, partial [Tricholoma matsutake]